MPLRFRKTASRKTGVRLRRIPSLKRNPRIRLYQGFKSLDRAVDLSRSARRMASPRVAKTRVALTLVITRKEGERLIPAVSAFFATVLPSLRSANEAIARTLSMLTLCRNLIEKKGERLTKRETTMLVKRFRDSEKEIQAMQKRISTLSALNTDFLTWKEVYAHAPRDYRREVARVYMNKMTRDKGWATILYA